MVRFIIYEEYTRKLDKVSFTFQYGQIYYEIPKPYFKSTK